MFVFKFTRNNEIKIFPTEVKEKQLTLSLSSIPGDEDLPFLRLRFNVNY